MTSKEFSIKLKIELLKNNMTTEQFAARLGINKVTLYRKIHKLETFTLADIIKIRDIFGKEVAEALFFGD